jgi:hypothetical protein
MARHRSDVVDPQEVLAALRELDAALRLTPYYGERSLFYNPRGAAPLGVLFASIKDHDGPNDKTSRLSRPGVYRLCFQLTSPAFDERFRAPPARPPRGEPMLIDFDPAALDELTPHPVYGWMRWVQILAPTRRHLQQRWPLIEESLELARWRWRRKHAA